MAPLWRRIRGGGGDRTVILTTWVFPILFLSSRGSFARQTQCTLGKKWVTYSCYLYYFCYDDCYCHYLIGDRSILLACEQEWTAVYNPLALMLGYVVDNYEFGGHDIGRMLSAIWLFLAFAPFLRKYGTPAPLFSEILVKIFYNT